MSRDLFLMNQIEFHMKRHMAVEDKQKFGRFITKSLLMTYMFLLFNAKNVPQCSCKLPMQAALLSRGMLSYIQMKQTRTRRIKKMMIRRDR